MSNKELTIPKHVAIFIDGSKLKPISEVMKLGDDQRLDHAALGDQLELIGVLYKGFSLLDLKEKMGHGQYLAALATHSISPASAWRAQNLAKLSLRVDASNFSALQNLNPTKLALMVKWDDDELNTFFAGEEIRGLTYDDAVAIPSREMERRLKEATPKSELQQKYEKERAARELAEEKARLLTRKQNKVEGFNYPPSIEKVRIESSVISSQALQCLDDMEQLVAELAVSDDLSNDETKSHAEYTAGSSTLYLNIKSVAIRANQLLSTFSDHIGDEYIPQTPEDQPLFSEAEALKVHGMREVMLAEHEINKKSFSPKKA